jgi:hypothetical protein
LLLCLLCQKDRAQIPKQLASSRSAIAIPDLIMVGETHTHTPRSKMQVQYLSLSLSLSLSLKCSTNMGLFIGLAYQGKDIVFRFIIEYSSLRDFGT